MSIDLSDADYNAINNRDERMRRLRRRRRPLWRLALASVYDLFLLMREARAALISFVVLVGVNVLYLLFGYDSARYGVEQLTLSSALYQTLRMLALETDIPLPRDADHFGQALFFIVPLLGLALVLQSVLNFGRFILDKSSRIEGWQISLARTYRDHVIVCGLGSITYRAILDLLEAGYGVVAIERDWSGEFVEQVLDLGVPVIHGDARTLEAMRHAGLYRARSLLAGLNDDLANIEIGLAARRRRPDLPIVLRIFDEDLDLNLEQTFGPNSVFSSSALAAPTLAAAALGRSIAHVLPLPPAFAYADGAPRLFGVLQLTITPASAFVGPLGLLEEQLSLRVLLHLKGGRLVNGERRRGQLLRLEPGDTVALLGPLDMLEQARLLNGGFGEGVELELRSFTPAPLPGTKAYDTVIVCGLGKIGYHVVQALDLLRPRPRIRLIFKEADTQVPLIDEVRPLVDHIIVGDARDDDILRQIGLDRAAAVVAATSDDLTNLQIGLTARRLAPDIDLVLRVYSDDLAERLETMFGAHTTFSVAALAAPTLAAASATRGIDYAVEVAEHILSTTTLLVRRGDNLEGRSVADLRREAQLLPLLIRRRGHIFIPNLAERLVAGDEVATLVDIGWLEQLRQSEAPPFELTLDVPDASSPPADAEMLLAELLETAPEPEPAKRAIRP